MKKTYNEPIKKRRKKISIFAGMPTSGGGNGKIEKIGYDIIEFVHAKIDDCLLDQYRIQRVLTHKR